MPPKTTSTWSFWTSFVAAASAALSSVALSSTSSSTRRPRRPPLSLMSPITMRATFALAIPMNESGPVRSMMTPALIGVDVFMALRVALREKLRSVGLPLVSRLFEDRRNVGIGHELLPALGIPVEDHPDAVLLAGIPEDDRALRAVLAAFVGALRREDFLEAVEILNRRRCQQHLLSSSVVPAPLTGAD